MLSPSLTRRALVLVPFVLSSVIGLTAQKPPAQQPAPVAGLRVERLETDAAATPLGIDDATPRLRWILASDRRNVMQTSARVLVASKLELAREGKADVWDSGSVTSADPWVVYGGPALKSATRYFWSVRVWAGSDLASDWAEPAWFETGLLNASDWHGQWIAGPERRGPLTDAEGAADDAEIRAAGEFCRPVGWLTSGWSAAAKKNNQGECRELRPAPMLRRSFRVKKQVARARLYASGLAYAALTVNGRRISDRELEPAFTNYAKTVLYTTDDVTDAVRQGENVVAAELGSGHFDDAARTWDWGWEEAEWRATPRLRLDLRITYLDGSEEIVASDGSWKVSTDGPTRYDSYYLGETYDARHWVPGWDRPGFNDSAWPSARVVAGPAGAVRAETHEPIRVVGARAPGTRSTPEPGIIVYDIGQNLTGWAEVEVEAPAGTPIEIFYSEKLASDGTATTDGNALVYGQLQTDYYVARGGVTETWRPRFTYKGFQYVQLSAPKRQPLPAGVKASVIRVDVVHTSVASTSKLEISQPTLSRIHRNTSWAIQSNMHGIITDTPVYEKNGWTGDAQLTSGAASLLVDTERLYRKMFQDMADAQTAQGEVPLLSPSNRNYGYVGKPAFKPTDCCGATPAWDAFWFVLPWESYRRYGDLRAVERTFPLMQKYLDVWVPQWTGRDGDKYAYTLTSGLGDWLPPKDVPTINALVSSAFYARMARIAADVARALGDQASAAKYDVLFGKITTDFNARFLGKDGVYREKPDEPFLQTAQILPLAFDLVPAAQRTAVAERLASDIMTKHDGHAWVGVIGASYVLPVLTATGHADLALTVATKTDEPGWGYWTDTLGFTALGESWPADTRSRNHHFFGAIVQWFYEDLAGLRPLAPGYARIDINPQMPPGLDAVKATYESVRGQIVSAWRKTADGVEVDVIVPPNARGRIHLPAAAEILETGSGTSMPAAGAPGVTQAATEAGRVIFDVGSGHYQFTLKGLAVPLGAGSGGGGTGMTTASARLRDFATRYTAAWCSHDPARVAGFFAPNGSLKVNDGQPAVGREAIADVARGFVTTFPDMLLLMDGISGTDERAVYRWTLVGTNSGPDGNGNKVRISGYEEWRFDATGLVLESRGHFDAEDYERQLEAQH
jgi:alpha-L-rhamnosidase